MIGNFMNSITNSSLKFMLSRYFFSISNDYPLLFLHLLAFSNYYYFLFGWTGNLIPNASPSIIIIKYISFLVVYIHFFLKNINKLSSIKLGKDFYLISLSIGFWVVIDFFHLFDYAIADWLRHRIINITIFLGLIPLFIIYYKEKEIGFLIHNCFNIMIFVGMINCVFGTYSYFFSAETLFAGRAIGLSQNPIAFGGIQYSCAVICLNKYFTHNRHFVYMALYLIFIFGIIISGTISCFVILVLSSIFIALNYLKDISFRKIFTILIFIFLLSIIFYNYLIRIDLFERIILIVSNPFHFETFSNRFNSYFSILTTLEQFSWQETIIGKMDSRYQTFDSMYLSVLYNSGLLGFIVFLSIFIYPIYTSYKESIEGQKNDTDVKIIILLILSYLFLGIFHSVQYKFPLNLFASINLALLIFNRLTKNEIKT